MLSPATSIEDDPTPSPRSSPEVLELVHVGLIPYMVCGFEKSDFPPVLLCLPLRGQNVERPISVL
jgi:hypothetical protein